MFFRPYPILTIASLLALGVLLSLGKWQLDRRVWKLDLIEKLEARPAMDAVPLESVWSGDEAALEAIEFRPVTVMGTFQHDAEMPVFGHLGAGNPGHFIITPLERAGKPPVLVNRGFVPFNAKDVTTTDRQVAGPVRLTGLIRRPQRRGPFTPDNDPETGTWYWRDFPAMAQAAGVPDALPLFVDANADATPAGGLPLGGASVVMPRNNHLGYAVTWFGFALCLLGVYTAYHMAHGRLGWRRG